MKDPEVLAIQISNACLLYCRNTLASTQNFKRKSDRPVTSSQTRIDVCMYVQYYAYCL